MKKPSIEVCKPCWELKYCPYGSYVELFPCVHDRLDTSTVGRIEEEHRQLLHQLANGEPKSESDLIMLAYDLLFTDPGNWRPLAEYSDLSEVRCNVFGHVCPVFYLWEHMSETRELRRFGRYIPRGLMLKVVKRDGHVCQICHKNVADDELEFDHIIPVSKGGPSSMENLRVVCRDCNRRKADSLSELLSDDLLSLKAKPGREEPDT